MYIHLTSKCNMSCAHCIWDYGAGKYGQDMTLTAFYKIVDFIDYFGCKYVTFGGGEITLHKNFEFILGYYLGNKSLSKPYIVTNDH